jgi:hypothetical protein
MVATTKAGWTSFVRTLDTTSQVAQYKQIIFDQIDARRLAGWEHAASCDGSTVSTTPGPGGDLLTDRVAAAAGAWNAGTIRFATVNATTDAKSWWIGRRVRSHDLSVDPGGDPYTYCLVAVPAVLQSATNPTGQILFGRRYTSWGGSPGTTTTLPAISVPTSASITQAFIPWTVAGPISAYTFCTYTSNGTMLFTARQNATYFTTYGFYYYGNEIGVRSNVDDGTGAYRTYEMVGSLSSLFTNGVTPTSISSNVSGAFATNSIILSWPGTATLGWSGGSPGRDEATGEWILGPCYVLGSSSTRQRRYGVIADIRESYGATYAEVVDGDTDPVRLVHIPRATTATSGGLWVPVTSSVIASML